ncbi:hypothetical protein KO525_10815 [Psychrosphaera sp. B3R10]|uniref:hypothetical protein n=1 Tax=unclassified Psychrosphaera TaxID=2641570 RepID=UPI001C0941AC|nr:MULTISPECIES: hypothetical protein [unclassified Psychrosphaera]MBU2881850.1 hypothetical protein [Psychrosphaera sp. I2R16]MBU2989871.1 hypothetical protein [Psychrosphaera sp. B3R10]
MNLAIPASLKAISLTKSLTTALTMTLTLVLSFPLLATNAPLANKKQIFAEVTTLITEHYVEKELLPKVHAAILQQASSI